MNTSVQYLQNWLKVANLVSQKKGERKREGKY